MKVLENNKGKWKGGKRKKRTLLIKPIPESITLIDIYKKERRGGGKRSKQFEIIVIILIIFCTIEMI